MDFGEVCAADDWDDAYGLRAVKRSAEEVSHGGDAVENFGVLERVFRVVRKGIKQKIEQKIKLGK